MPTALAFGLFFSIVGLAALVFGIYALLRSGRHQRGGAGWVRSPSGAYTSSPVSG